MTKQLPQRICCHMRNVLNILLLVIFLCSGVSNLPACYATKLDCEKRSSVSSCPLSSNIPEQACNTESSCPAQCISQANEPVGAEVPLDRYKRLKIEQRSISPVELPPFIPSFSVTAFIETDREKASLRPTPGLLSTPHYPSPPLFLSHQSFLI